MKKTGIWIMILFVLIAGAAFVWAMHYGFEHSEMLRGLFSGVANETVGEAGPDAGATLAARSRLTAQISMYIFSVITVLQFAALAAGVAVVSGIRGADTDAQMKLKQLDNAEIFFDIPLYVGLFGTVSAFLVMTFSPQSSRLIAYSSTLIGIIFSLILRLTLQYPLRKRLITVRAGGDDK